MNDLRSNRQDAQSAKDKASANTSSRAKSGTGGERLVTSEISTDKDIDSKIAETKAKNEAASKADKPQGLGALSAALRKASPKQ